MTDIEELERIVRAGDRYGHNTPGVTLELIAEVRRLRALLNNRPALNVGLVEAYHAWTAGVYASDISPAKGETKQ